MLDVDGRSSTHTSRSHFSEADGRQIKLASSWANSARVTNNPKRSIT